MRIHFVNKGETLAKIAESYGVKEEHIRITNGIPNGEATNGEQLLILYPTRTHTTRADDTIERICLRYRTRKSDILSLNPWLRDGKMNVGKSIVLKYDERTHGMAVTNGYIYKGCTEEKLRDALPYMTYATFACLIKRGKGIESIFNEGELLNTALENGKIPLVKIYGDCGFDDSSKTEALEFYDKLIEDAKRRGFMGIVLNAAAYKHSAVFYSSIIMDLRKRMIGSDLILITEVDESTPTEFNELSDGSILSYSKLWEEDIPDFERGEKSVISGFACNGESTKTFIELPAFARLGNGFAEIEEIKRKARSNKIEILHNEATLLSEVNLSGLECRYPDLKNEKAVLELLSEYGYMGICFDVMRTPPSYLAMYNAMFKTVNHLNVN